MSEYINTLIVTVIVSQLAVKFAPSRESAVSYLRLICGITVFLCMMSPISAVISNGAEFIDELKGISTIDDSTPDEEDKYAQSAGIIMRYLIDNYRINEDDISMTVITDENNLAVIELHIYLKSGGEDIHKAIEREMNKELSVPVYVFGG